MASNQEEQHQHQPQPQQPQPQQPPEQQEQQNPTAHPPIPAPAPAPATASDATTIAPHPRRGKFLSPPTPTSSAPPPATAAAVSSSVPSSTAIPPPTPSNPPAPTTHSAPPTPSTKSRGKFLGAVPSASPPPSSSPAAVAATTKPVVRGAGKNFQTLALSSSPSSSHAGGGGGNGNQHPLPGDANETSHPSLAALRSRVAAARSSVSRKRQRLLETREKVFRNLDEAEDLVLGLLRCASEAAGELRDMTGAAVGGGEEKKDGKGSERASFQELAVRVRENGKAYLAGVKRLHGLLAPHAPLVKSYRNHRRDDDNDDDNNNNVDDATDQTVMERIVANATSNMYAARVEKRLAAERSEILKEMLRLEKREAEEEEDGNAVENEKRNGKQDNTDMDDDNGDATMAGSKRKLEAIAVE